MSDDDENESGANDDSSEDVPLTSLSNKKKKNEDNDDDDDDAEEEEEDEESSSRKRRSASSAVNYAEDDGDEVEEEDEEMEEAEEEEQEEGSDDDSEDEDVPLSALKGNSPKKKKTPTKKKATPAKKKTTAKKKKTTTTKKKEVAQSAPKYISASSVLYGSGCDKGRLIQSILCRWWYAMNWPDPACIPNKPPANCDALDGFPGVYVQTSGDDVGQIVDLRDKDKAPTFYNLAKKSAEELQALLITAVEEQTKQLVEVEGQGTETEKELKKLLTWAKKVKTAKADKDAVKVLKAKKLSID